MVSTSLRTVVLALALSVASSAQAFAAITHLETPTRGQCGAACTSVAATAFTNTPVAGDVILASVLWIDLVNSTAGTVAISDGSGHSLTVQAPADDRPTSAGLVYQAVGIVGTGWGKTWTATFNTTLGGVASLWVHEFTVASGTAAFNAWLEGTGTTGTALNTPTCTNAAGDLIYSAALSDHQVSSVNGVWTSVAAGTGNQFSEGIGYVLSAAGSSVAVNMTQNQTSGWDSACLSVTFTAAGGASPPTRSLLGVGK